MARFWGENRRDSTVKSDNGIHRAYFEVIGDLGGIAAYVSRGEIYRRVAEKVGMCTKTVANVLNHTEYTGE